MPKNPFKDNQDFVSKPKRNAFDLSFQNNLTMKLGTLYPVFCKECLPGDSFQIDADFGLKFLPLLFPMQTPMRATMHFFYVRNRNLWKNWMDFYGMTKDGLVHPFISNDDPEFWRTGSLADYLGVPSTVTSINYGSGIYPFHTMGVQYARENSAGVVRDQSNAMSVPLGVLRRIAYVGSPISALPWPMTLGQFPSFFNDLDQRFSLGDLCSMNASYQDTDPEDTLIAFGVEQRISVPVTELNFTENIDSQFCLLLSVGDSWASSKPNGLFGTFQGNGTSSLSLDEFTIAYIASQVATYGGVYITLLFLPSSGFKVGDLNNQIGLGLIFGKDAASNVLDDIADRPASNPFLSRNRDVLISALPFRAYEQIYNAYYRNVQNDPFMVDGQAEYNKYGTTYEDGADSTPYHLFQRNWEMDFLTSALPSPQQGMAPLVGVSALGDIQIDDGENGIITFHGEVGEDGDTVVGGSWHHPNPSIQARQTMMELITGGFSINDFRNVNSFQRFLETNMRRGLRYKDVVLGHTGVNVKYDELDMPEFIGGFSRMVQVSQVLQSVDQGDDSPLGSYAGNANCFGGSRHSIRHYCDEPGFIMGILCVIPQPSYSQLLPKHFLHRETLDYYFPEFGHLGMQPITYEEVCPIQTKVAQSDHPDYRFTDVFGYQRPWYDLLASVDEVHGQMRTTMRDFLMNRLFNDRPELGHDFLAIDPMQVNNVFAVQDETQDVVQGQIAFRCFVKRMIPRYGIPRLE